MKNSTRINSIAEVISKDLGNRGISNLVDFDALEKSCLNLCNSKTIIVLSGFCIPPIGKVETDGPLGALIICEALIRLKKTVHLILDEVAFPLFKYLSQEVGLTNSSNFFIREVPIKFSKESAHVILKEIRPDHLLAIERPGLGKDGVSYNMGGKPCSSINAPMDFLFDYPDPPRGLTSTCVGDGGNELGFGKKYELVKKYVPKGEKIGCVTEADEVVVCGVSNWGGFGISAGLCLMNDGNVSDFLWSDEKHMLLMKEMQKAGAIDGVSLKKELTVDGMEFTVHQDILSKIRKICVE